MMVRRRFPLVMAAAGLLTVSVVLWAPTVGSTPISLSRAFDPALDWQANVDAQIFFVARLPRVLAGALVGAALAAAGVVLQALLRNPLATPFTLGVSSGAALGAMLATAFRLEATLLGISAVPLASFAGSMLATAIVYALAASQRRGLSTNVLLLAGVTLNAFFSALILFVQYFADMADALRAVRWLMGDLDVGTLAPLAGALPLLLLSAAGMAVLPRALNLLTMGEDVAASRGVDVAGAQRLAFVSASLATGPPSRWAGPWASSASSCRTSSASWWAPITAWCFRRPRSWAQPSSWPATCWHARCSPRWKCLWASSRPSLAAPSSSGCW